MRGDWIDLEILKKKTTIKKQDDGELKIPVIADNVKCIISRWCSMFSASQHLLGALHICIHMHIHIVINIENNNRKIHWTSFAERFPFENNRSNYVAVDFLTIFDVGFFKRVSRKHLPKGAYNLGFLANKRNARICFFFVL